jgi:pentatricopeptide repeat protein
MYTSIISVLGKAGDWERAWALFQGMQRPQGGLLPLKPDKVLVFTMVRILEKAGQLERAAKVKQSSLQISRDDLETPTSPRFNDLIREGKRYGDFKLAVQAADAWLSLNSSLRSPSGVTACINVYGFAVQPEKALNILDRLKERGLSINVVQVSSD